MASTRKKAVLPQSSNQFSDYPRELATGTNNYHNGSDNRIILRRRRVQTEKKRR